MPTLTLPGCTATPFGSYLKAIGLLRLVSEQADDEACGWWAGNQFEISSTLSEAELVDFFLARYVPTPILAPWNGGSGFYEKDRKVGIDAIAGSTDQRFSDYRAAIGTIRQLKEVASGKADKSNEDARREAILLQCRNRLSDPAVEWLDATVGISAEGSRAFAPVLGTGGNEGRLDYTNNFMERLAGLLISPDKKTPVRALLENALFGRATEGLQSAAAGQFDPGRAGGANQGPGIAHESTTNPWDFVLTLEGAVAWASGLYRRHGVSFRSYLCSPFTVSASTVGYGSASEGDEARAEIWAPLWEQPARFAELKVLLREGRASVDGQPAKTGLQFAEAACSLGVDRGIRKFVRYNLLKRRGDSYVALPAGVFPVEYRSISDLIRELEAVLAEVETPPGGEAFRRRVDSAIYEALLHGGADRVRAALAAFGRLLRKVVTTSKGAFPRRLLGDPGRWLDACAASACPEVRIAAALASIWDKRTGLSIRDNLTAGRKEFAWIGRDLPGRLMTVLQRWVYVTNAEESEINPYTNAFRLDAGDATLFVEGSTDDSLIEDLLFAFVCVPWSGIQCDPDQRTEVMPVYAALKHLFLWQDIRNDHGEVKRLSADARALALLAASRLPEAADLAIHRLKVAGLRPIEVPFPGGVHPRRLAASLLFPIWNTAAIGKAVLHDPIESA